MNRRGLTLLELTIAMFIAAALIASTFVFYEPSVILTRSIASSDQLRLQLSNPMDQIEKEASSMRSIYVDPSKCYLACMVDSNGNRTYYWWGTGTNDANTLYRKKESVNNTLSCSGGSVFIAGLDKTKTTFSATQNSLIVNLAANGADGHPYQLTNRVFPSLIERSAVFTEGFECNTLMDGWAVNAGTRSSWSIMSAGGHSGNYEISDFASGSGSDTTTVEIPIDMSRISTAHLKFAYMNSGTIAPPDSFTASLTSDGTNYQTLFADSTGQMVSSYTTIEVDLTPYALSNTNKIKFAASLSHTGAHWFIDDVSVFTP